MVKGWFRTEGRDGDRTLEQQLTGLELLFVECAGKSILDVGCAEGLISIALAEEGANHIHGIEIIERYIPLAQLMAGDLPCLFEVGDANTWGPPMQYDIVIALGLLHKLRDPSATCWRLASACRDLMVIRLPPKHAPTIIDARSDNRPYHIGNVMKGAGFALEQVTRGHLDEWCGFWRRIR